MGLLFGDADLDAMKRLRRAFDPEQRSNPGKILPSTRFCMEANPKARGYGRVPLVEGDASRSGAEGDASPRPEAP
ncbi:MAG TPA: FAD-linked oxidase C-terminal domain-containing protein, partial [Myxococcota bacterium]|nr:FAD-linked oxidase C-terminal domain-containing protein [Myxococcota bacterium]